MLQLRQELLRLELLIFKIVTTNLNVISKLKDLEQLGEFKLPERQNLFLIVVARMVCFDFFLLFV